MTAKIVPKKSTVSGKIPDAASLSSGEIAINLTDGKLYAKHTDGTIVNLSGAPELHTHQISQVDGLQSALDGKADSSHSHTASDLPNDVMYEGDNVSLLTNDAGYIIASEAPVQSVNGQTGSVSLTNNDVGLGNVTNDEQVKKSGDTMTGRLTISSATYRNHLYLTRGSNTAEINPSTGRRSGVTPELRFGGNMNGYWFDGRVKAEDGFYGDGSNLEMVDADKLGGQESSYYVSQEEAQDKFTMLFALGS